ncbi:MAG: HEAT repeat domain-containing protein [Planctomycetota bacterium]|nr:HEAT repeat domain-containing protein [Planctomycetota bacterium]
MSPKLEDLELGGGYKPEVATPPAPRRRGTAFVMTVLQLFVFPLAIVIVSTSLFVGFRWLTYERTSPHDLLQKIRSNRSTSGKWPPSHKARWQAAFELYSKLRDDESAREDPRLAAAVVQTFNEMAEGDSPKIRMYLAGILGILKAKDGTAALERALDDSDAQVRVASAISLGLIGDPRAVPSLIAKLEDGEPFVRKVIAHTLGRLGSAEAIEPLKERLGDPVDDVRWNVALALAGLQDASGIHVIRKMLTRDYMEGVIRTAAKSGDGEPVEARADFAMINAIEGVVALRDASLTSVVEGLSKEDSSIKVRARALQALEELRSERGAKE